MPRPPSDTLRQLLSQQKAEYLQSVAEGKGREWTVVMGNEAGDLDSLASAIAYAWYRRTAQKDTSVSLVQTPRSDLPLRAENLYAMELAGIDPSHILCIDEVSPSKPFPSSKFALVDHNRLGNRFTQDNPDASVVAVIDHHEDEGLYQTSADPRIIAVPTGSASSLVTRFLVEHCSEIPAEIATLLLCGILVDTNGLKPGGKAEQIDREAADFLASRSLLSVDGFAGDLHDSAEVQELNATLQSRKGDVSHLETRDLLRRDYKEYTLQPSWAEPSIAIGLCSVPVGLHPWIADDKAFWTATVQWMDERNLAAVGILTSFRDDHKTNKHGKGKHRREQLYVVREGGSVEGVADKLFHGLKHSKELDLKKRSFEDDYGVVVGLQPEGTFRARVWEQGNADATRKVTAPLVKKIIEG